MAALRLIPIDHKHQAALSSDPAYREAMEHGDWTRVANCVQRILGASGALPEDVSETSASDVSQPRGGFVAIDRALDTIVGSCAFKAPPNEIGDIEIAYFTYPGHEGRGYATAMANTLVALAVNDSTIRQVIAHTLPEPSASTRVLEKAGFTHAGDAVDPEDGPVWRWRRNPRP